VFDVLVQYTMSSFEGSNLTIV